ncbi:MAG: hypothetical protein NT069_11640 [Planctomycetota bacterium]|nr:hypothetical protein [Planctomycetota bacterium]
MVVPLMMLWVCGMLTEADGCRSWELVGAFTEKRAALAACDDEDFFVFPLRANEKAPRESVAPVEMEWPRRGGGASEEPPDFTPPRIPR